MHDATYKMLYSKRHMVAELLRGFLPGGASAGFDFDTLERLPTSHVGPAMERREGDLMWRLRAREAPAEGWVHVLVLLEFQSGVDRSMALRLLTYTGLALEEFLRSEKRDGGKARDGEEGQAGGKAQAGEMARSREDARSGGESRPVTPLPLVIPFVVYNGSPPWTAPADVSKLAPPASPALEQLQPRNRYVLLDMHRSDTAGVPEDNAVGLQVALVRATPEEAREILPRLGAALPGPQHRELREAFAKWLRRLWNEEYDLEAGADEALRRELDRLEAAGEVVAMASLTAERWKQRQRQKEAQIRARAMAEGHAERLEFERRLLASLAARRFGADTGERLSALLARVSEPEPLTAVGEAIIDYATGADLLAAAQGIVDPAN